MNVILRALIVTVSFSVLTLSGFQEKTVDAHNPVKSSEETEEKVYENGMLPLTGLEIAPVEPLPVPNDDSLTPLPLKQ